jgi:uncharacterized membrane protein (UPF0136 family)
MMPLSFAIGGVLGFVRKKTTLSLLNILRKCPTNYHVFAEACKLLKDRKTTTVVWFGRV